MIYLADFKGALKGVQQLLETDHTEEPTIFLDKQHQPRDANIYIESRMLHTLES